MSEFDSAIAGAQAARRRNYRIVAGAVLSLAVVVVLVMLLQHWLSGRNAAETETTATNSTISEPTTNTNGALRVQAQQLLSSTRGAVQAANENQPFANFLGSELATLQAQLSLALASYSNADYASAITQLEAINNALRHGEQALQRAYNEAFSAATAAFQNHDIAAATAANQRALTLKPASAEAQALQERIDVFADVQRLLAAAQVAAVENNLARVQELLSQVLMLDPAHRDAEQWLAEVTRELTEQAFLAAVAQALQAFEQGELNAANRYLDSAESKLPNRAEVRSLRTEIQAQQRANAITAAEQQLAIFAAADEWPTVVMVANNALQRYPNEPQLQHWYEQGQAISAQQANVNAYLAQPERLADLQVLTAAEQALNAARRWADESPKLQHAISQLSSAITTAMQPVEVVLLSDNATFVRVLGVGNVGTHEQYRFTLRPGVYQFEGRRNGFRSRIIEVRVEASAAPITVRLVADERI